MTTKKLIQETLIGTAALVTIVLFLVAAVIAIYTVAGK